MIALGVDIGGTSVKAAIVRGDHAVATGRSDPYQRPDLAGLQRAIAAAVAPLGGHLSRLDAVGLCLPGLVDRGTGQVIKSVNMPALVGADLNALLRDAIGTARLPMSRFSDAHAATFDVWNGRPGRLAGVSIGAGVGLCVLDDGIALDLGDGSAGHLGQLDVTLDPRDAPIGPDGGRGGLEAYVGWPALRSRFGRRVSDLGRALTEDETPLRALARAIRIIHAIHRPQRIVLLGGVGIELHAQLDRLRSLVSDRLTSLAREGCTLEAASSPHHAAVGAARLALNSGSLG